MNEKIMSDTEIGRALTAMGVDFMSETKATLPELAIRFGILPPDEVSVEDLSTQEPQGEV